MARESSRHSGEFASPTEGVFTFGPFEFDPGPRLLYRGEKEILLPPRAAAVLEVFLRRPDKVISKDELLDAVWKDAFVSEDSLTQAISLVRHALGDQVRNPTYIKTMPKRGYRFLADVRRGSSEGRGRPQGDGTVPSAQAPGRSEDTAIPIADAAPNAAAVAGLPAEGTSPAVARPAVGRQLGQYEILGSLGAGGMGAVWRARDSSLAREVAIKVLPDDVVADRERAAWFEREARLLASVSHPNIAHIYSLEEAGGIKFSVMELVEGSTLAQLLEHDRLSVKEALEIGRQIASGLEAAHRRGIVHRDLKPANIKVTPEGRAKVLDFGLAWAVEVKKLGSGVAESPTESITIGGSYRGALAGTVAYMSPEQARGREIDRRADIWAFGCVLYEALTGRRAFGRATVADTLVAILEQEPDWSALPLTTPPLARSLIRRCLQKEPEQRLHDIADARLQIEEALSEPAPGSASSAAAVSTTALRREVLPWGIAAVAIAVAGWSLMQATAPEPPPVARLLVEVEPGQHLTGGHVQETAGWALQRPSRKAMVLSADGQRLVYAAAAGDGRRLYLREMDEPQATPIPGTEGASSPFLSPDDQWIGFFASDDLKKVPIEGGDPRTVVADAPPPFGATWGDNDTIVFADGESGGLLQVSAAGGTPEALTTLDGGRGEVSHRLPQMLPGGRAVLFTVMFDMNWENAEIVVESLETGERKVLITAGADARFVPTGHLLFVRQGKLMAASFALERLEVTGEPVPVVENIMQANGAANTALDTGAAQFVVSATGSLVYVPGGTYPEPERSLVLVDRNGEPRALPMPPRAYSAPRLSPDGQQLAYLSGRRASRDVWVYDNLRRTSRRLTFGESSAGPVWSPDGKRLVFPSDRGRGAFNLHTMAADGSGEPERLTTSSRHQFASSWSSDGVLAFVEGASEIWLLPLEGEGEPRPSLFLDTPFIEQWPTFSPDGRWLAYASDETGENEVYVRPYPGPDPAVRISTEGGHSPAWSPDGRELFYRNRDKMMVVDVTTTGTFTHGSPSLLFDGPRYLIANPTRAYDVTADGEFVMVTATDWEPEPVTQMHIVLNWFEELKRLAPGGQ